MAMHGNNWPVGIQNCYLLMFGDNERSHVARNPKDARSAEEHRVCNLQKAENQGAHETRSL
jgi:hypothetical protein